MQLFNIANTILGIVLFGALFVVDRQVQKRHKESACWLGPGACGLPRAAKPR